jgi:hypothetical protein
VKTLGLGPSPLLCGGAELKSNIVSEGSDYQCVQTLREAVVVEQAHPVYYPDVLPRPSSEMWGEMLLLLKSPGEALDAYKVALKIAPIDSVHSSGHVTPL